MRSAASLMLAIIFCGCVVPRAAGAAELPAAAMIEDRITAVEADIGRLMQKRVDSSTGVPRELELRIDVRIIARSILAQAAAAPAGSHLQASAWIRAADLFAAAELVEQEI